MEEQKEEKIGFGSAPPDPTMKHKKFKPAYKKTKTRRFCLLFMTLGSIFTVISIMYFFAAAFNAILMIVIALLIILLIIFLCVFTLGLALVSDEFRAWVGKIWSIVTWMSNLNDNIDKISPYFPVFAFPALGLNLIGIMIGIIGQTKEKRGYVSYIIALSLNIISTVTVIILYYANGSTIIH